MIEHDFRAALGGAGPNHRGHRRPAIQKGLGIQPSPYIWLTIAHLVSSTVIVTIYGKLGDVYGRQAIMVFGVPLFVAVADP